MYPAENKMASKTLSQKYIIFSVNTFEECDEKAQNVYTQQKRSTQTQLLTRKLTLYVLVTVELRVVSQRAQMLAAA